MMRNEINVLIVGVGGQGIILASRILTSVFFKAGYDVKQSEVHGMAQRGGAVSSHIRAGEKVHSPLIPTDALDFLLAFEKMEALRYGEYITKRTTVIISDNIVLPPSVIMGKTKYPENIVNQIKKAAKEVIEVPATRMASEIGDTRVSNSILMGFLASKLLIDKKIWIGIIKREIKKSFVKQNIGAFNKGCSCNK